MSEHVDVLVVGSGFGGSVSACRYAQAGRSVVLMERGHAYPPGSFARTPTEMTQNFWDPSRGMHGLFDLWSFDNFEAVVSSGLGGGSLIYANVLLRKDEKWFVTESPTGDGYESWPITRADLEPYYPLAEAMLGAQPFPKGEPGYEASRKTQLLEDAGVKLGYTAQQPPLAVTFGLPGQRPVPGAPIPAPDFGNLHGLPRSTCVLCGECDIGCNSGSKNTLDHTYLSAAQFSGADLRTGHEVRTVAPSEGGGYTVGYVVHEPGVAAGTDSLPLREITCDQLVLAAGTLGTTYLLLRNRGRDRLAALSARVGHRFSGNGDLLGFVLGCPQPPLGSSKAPVITTAVRVPDAVDGGTGRGFYVEDAGYPWFAEWLVEASQVRTDLGRAAGVVRDVVVNHLRHRPQHEIGALAARLVGSGVISAGATPLLGMGRDVPSGVMSLEQDYLQIGHYPKDSRHYFDTVQQVMVDLAEAMGGHFDENPLTRLSRVITVHPLGGASMGADPAVGVVDQWGEVYGHPGLFVADGSAMPGPVGANPSLTIAAFAERQTDHVLGRTS